MSWYTRVRKNSAVQSTAQGDGGTIFDRLFKEQGRNERGEFTSGDGGSSSGGKSSASFSAGSVKVAGLQSFLEDSGFEISPNGNNSYSREVLLDGWALGASIGTKGRLVVWHEPDPDSDEGGTYYKRKGKTKEKGWETQADLSAALEPLKGASGDKLQEILDNDWEPFQPSRY